MSEYVNEQKIDEISTNLGKIAESLGKISEKYCRGNCDFSSKEFHKAVIQVIEDEQRIGRLPF